MEDQERELDTVGEKDRTIEKKTDQKNRLTFIIMVVSVRCDLLSYPVKPYGW